MRQNSAKEHLLKLTSAVYRVTALFPVGEELGLKIRESADRVLNGAPVDEILGLLDLAEKKNWIDPRNFLVLRREYDKMRPRDDSGKTVDSSNNYRQDKIIETINENGKVRIGELVGFFPGLNRRTILRDLDKLCQTGVAIRNGNGRGAYYIRNGHNATMSQ